MNTLRMLAAGFSLVLGLSVMADEKTPDVKPKESTKAEKAKLDPKEVPTHEKTKEIVIKQDGNYSLQTLCTDLDGRVLAVVAPSRYFTAPGKGVTSEVHTYTADGKKVSGWKIPFHVHSINVGPDGTVYVAGDGKVAKFSKDGKELGQLELPHIAELVKDKEKIKKEAAAELEEQQKQFADAKKQFTTQLEKLEKKKAEDLTATEKKQLEQFKLILKSYEESEKFYKSRTVESVVAETMNRMKIINGIAVSEKDVFVVCGVSKGYGYAVWRMTHDFKEPKQVNKDQVVGCCGQMDIQVSGTDYLLAENTNHKFARYDRDGKLLGTKVGKSAQVIAGKECPADCFGGCCNPMNVRVGTNGDVFTAESEGLIKRYSAKGEFLGLVAKSPLTGGCKNVAVAVSKDANTVFFCDQPGSKILILTKKTKDSTGTN